MGLKGFIELFFEEVDIDEDGRISIYEFCRFLRFVSFKLRIVKSFFGY